MATVPTVQSRTAIPVVAVAILLATSFVALATALAWERPLCCADDAVFAVVAKNLAGGHGYVPTFGPFLDRPFAPWLGTGPTSILSAAAAIAVVGPDARVPGLAHILLWTGLLALALRAAMRLEARPWELLAVFVALQFATSAWHFEQWYALLGEVPAAMLVILGTALLAREDGAGRHVAASGIAFGAATLGKLLSALYLVGPFLWLAWTLLPRSRERSPAAVRRALVFGTGLLAPHAAFELWKLSVLGVAGWWNQMTSFATFVLEYGAGDAPADRWAEFVRRSVVLDDRFAFSPLLFAVTIVLAWLGSRHLPRATRRFVWLLLGGVGIHLFYWLLLSDGRPRYAHIATVLWGFALATLLATVRGTALRLGFSVVVAWTLVTGLPRLDRPLKLLAEARDPETSPFAAAQFVADAIRTTTGGAPIGAVGGAHVAVLEYLSDEPGRFRIPPNADGPVAWVIVDDRLLYPKDPVFAELFAECPTEVVRRPPYTLRRCSGALETD